MKKLRYLKSDNSGSVKSVMNVKSNKSDKDKDIV